MSSENNPTTRSRFLGLKRLDWLVAIMAVVAIIFVALLVLTNTSQAAKDFTGQDTVSLTIDDEGLSTPNITISSGTTVTWKNTGQKQHSVMHEHEHDEHSHAATTRDNIDPDIFSSPALEPGESYSYTFKASDSTAYHDSLDPKITGKITVVE